MKSSRSLILSFAAFLACTGAAHAIVVSTLEGHYDDRVSETAGYEAFANATLSNSPTDSNNPNGQGFRDDRDNVLTFQFSDNLQLDKLLLGVYGPVSSGTGTLKIFEVADVSAADLTSSLAGTPAFSESFSVTATTFTSLYGTDESRPAGTLVFDLDNPFLLEDRSSEGSTAGYAFQWDLDGGSTTLWNADNTSGSPTGWASYYRKDQNYATVGNNTFMVGFVPVPEPSAGLLLMLGLAGLAGFRRRRRG